MPTIIAGGSVAKCQPRALRIFRWWGGFADESGAVEEAIAFLLISRSPIIGRIGIAITRIYRRGLPSARTIVGIYHLPDDILVFDRLLRIRLDQKIKKSI